MIIPAESPPPAARPRPATVTVAFRLQLGLVAVLLVLAVLMVVDAVAYSGLIDRAAELTNADPDEVSMERAFNVEWAVMTGLPAIALLALFAATALPVRSGSNVARILTCVGAGFPLLCCGVAGGAGTLAMVPLLALEPEELEQEEFLPGDSPFYDKLYELESAGPTSGLAILIPILIFAAIAMAVAIAVLLLVPPSNRYYRPEQPPPLQTPVYPSVYPVPPGYALVPVSALILPVTAPTPPAPGEPPAADPPEKEPPAAEPPAAEPPAGAG
ncbi:hypothetical protein [Phytohabitans kaempferiae]|uniref:Uncharacterized protein n=1 Tax=Phytohabitans kaempferiae TaxID=1620943 RepID=A0ABV6MB69_9ACTN